uniref:Uncharacterized protein n=1 Tax=uncultured prokaryote TaxID=198431 RepID=A0A0H5Q6C2_9ZZZZ|nr:hypothetical protein [uncultured prokaryote]
MSYQSCQPPSESPAVALRVKTSFTGYPGTPYYNSLIFDGTEVSVDPDLCDYVEAFWTQLLLGSAPTLAFEIDNGVEVFDPGTGEITSVVTGSGGDGVGAGIGEYLPPATQGLLRLSTGTYLSGRRVAGKVFIPGIVDGSGHNAPEVGFQSNTISALNALILATAESNPLMVWAHPQPVTETKPGRAGIIAQVNGGSVWDKWAVLRSRRD